MRRALLQAERGHDRYAPVLLEHHDFGATRERLPLVGARRQSRAATPDDERDGSYPLLWNRDGDVRHAPDDGVSMRPRTEQCRHAVRAEGRSVPAPNWPNFPARATSDLVESLDPEH